MFDVVEAPTQTMTPPPDLVAPEDLVDELSSVLAHRDRIDARAGDLIRQIGVADAFRRDGYSSLTALLKHRMSLHQGKPSGWFLAPTDWPILRSWPWSTRTVR
jgi:hypothetical protein